MNTNHEKKNHHPQKIIPLNNKLVSSVRKNMLYNTNSSQKKIKKDTNKNYESSLEKNPKINFKFKLPNSKKNKFKKEISYYSILCGLCILGGIYHIRIKALR